MDYPYTLKHLSRSPLPLDRVPSHLCVEIILKQSVHSIFNLPHTNSRCAVLVEAALSSDPNMAIIQEILTKIDRKELLDFLDYWPVKMEKPFPPSNFGTPADDACLSAWQSQIFFDVALLVSHQKKDHKEVLPKQLHWDQYSLTDLWKDQQRRGPRQIPLQSLPDGLWRKIMAKTTAISAIRLAKTRSTVTAAFDGYVESVVSILVMIQSGHLLVNDGHWTELTIRVRLMNYNQYSLLLSSFKTNLWPITVDRSINEQLRKQHEKCSSKRSQTEENRWKYELLGYTFIPEKGAIVNQELLCVPKHL